MPASDAGFKIAARASGRELAAIAGVACDSWAPAVSEVQTTERLADRVFQARRAGERFLVYMEAYTYWKTSAPWSILSKSALLSERERLPTVSLVYVLRPRGYRPQKGSFSLAVDGTPTQQVWFREICLWEQEPQAWWDQVPGLMALSPLCSQERGPHEAVTHAAAAIAAQTHDAIARADLLTTLAIFGKLAFPHIDVAGLIGREQMKESKIIEEFQQEARVEAQREDILQVLDIRFGARAATEFAPQLENVSDNKRLTRLHRLAVQATALKQFRDQFHKF
jgi:hypothetical protein